MIDEIKKIKSGKKQLKECGVTVGLVLLLIGGVMFFKEKTFFYVFVYGGSLFCLAGLFFCKILLPFQKVWMSIAIILGFFVSRIILTILFFLVISPLGLILKLCKKDILDQKIEPERLSYWKDVSDNVKEKESYEKQY